MFVESLAALGDHIAVGAKSAEISDQVVQRWQQVRSNDPLMPVSLRSEEEVQVWNEVISDADYYAKHLGFDPELYRLAAYHQHAHQSLNELNQFSATI